MAKLLGFKQVVEGEFTPQSDYLYFVRTNDSKTDGYLYLNGKKYGTGYDLVSLLNEKQNTILINNITSNDENTIELNPDVVNIFSYNQTFNSKVFNINIPSDRTKEYTWTLRFLIGDVSSAPSISFTASNDFTIRWKNNEIPLFNSNKAYEIVFKYIPGVNLLLGVCSEF